MHFDTLFWDQTFWNWGLNSVAYLENRRRAIKKKAAILLGTHQREKKERRRKVVEERVSLFSASKYCSIMQIPLEDATEKSRASKVMPLLGFFPQFRIPWGSWHVCHVSGSSSPSSSSKILLLPPHFPRPTQLVNWIFPVSFSIQFRWFFFQQSS